ncbi:hypothetical protein A9Q99_14410 [Gammaproteobacteria bacterium 45_16_T64]|nr:hypothetical protein A9Q99_14410 [Gammaproteobacteria bacterium 45_16_T64]
MTTRYFLAFAVSPELKSAADNVLDHYERKTPESWSPHFDTLMELFIPAFLKALMLDTCDAVGLSPRASKLIHSASNTLSKTITAMVGKLLKKRTNEELEPLAQFVKDTYLTAETCSNGKVSVGCELGEKVYNDITRLTGEVRDGRLDEVRDELAVVMIQVVDACIDNMMVEIIGLLKVNFVVKKICDAAVVTSRAAGHMVVNKVFKDLDEPSMLRLGDFFDDMLVTDVR